MKKLLLSALLLYSFVASALPATAQGGPTFSSRWQVERDAVARMSRPDGLNKVATLPGQSNYVRVEGDAILSYGFAIRVAVPGDETRFECATMGAGCGLISPADHLIVYAHLGGQVGCFDGPSTVAYVNLIYRRVGSTWTLLSQ